MRNDPLELIYSYSHKDESLRDELEAHLSILIRQGMISSWHDRKIGPGKEWASSIDAIFQTAKIILLLVSPDFIASDYCYTKEMVTALERHECNDAIVIPIIIRPVDWKTAPFSKLLSLPIDGLPVTSWNNRDEAWVNVVEGIRNSIKQFDENIKKVSTHPIVLKDILINEFKRLEDTTDTETFLYGVSTGFKDLDGFIGGLHNGDLYVVASRPSMGKLDLIISISSQIAIENDKPILIFSMKYSGEKITRKFTCLLSSLNSQSLLRGLMKDSEWVRLTQAASRLGDAPIFIDDRPIITLSDLVSQTRRINNKNKLGLLVIDDLQHITIEDDSNILSSAPQITRQLRALAKEIQVPLLTSSQLIPEIENRPNKRPQINDFGSWDILADDANVILFPYRDEFYHPSSQSNEGILEVIVAKNDYGSTGFFRLSYSPAVSRLANYSAVEIDE